jgi:predicted O-methyltransferase YrrM
MDSNHYFETIVRLLTPTTIHLGDRAIKNGRCLEAGPAGAVRLFDIVRDICEYLLAAGGSRPQTQIDVYSVTLK